MGAVSSSKVIAFAGLLLLMVALGGRWLDRNTRPHDERRAKLSASAESPPSLEVTATQRMKSRSTGGPSIPVAARQTARGQASAVPRKSKSATAPVRPGKEPIQDLVAREALFYVGADPEAEEIWLTAINDPSLSAQERQDLIEDLNEDGLPDPHSPTLEDLPLLVRRIALIEEVGPDAMDEVNADAFEEAYKDLLNLVEVAMSGVRPVD